MTNIEEDINLCIVEQRKVLWEQSTYYNGINKEVSYFVPEVPYYLFSQNYKFRKAIKLLTNSP